MTDAQRLEIQSLRASGCSYGAIAEKLGVKINSVKSYCRRKGLIGRVDTTPKEESTDKKCLCCGKDVGQQKGRKAKKFCSDKCRSKWWYAHSELTNKQAVYDYECPYCHTLFQAYGNAHRKYCSHACYIADRFGGGRDE